MVTGTRPLDRAERVLGEALPHARLYRVGAEDELHRPPSCRAPPPSRSAIVHAPVTSCNPLATGEGHLLPLHGPRLLEAPAGAPAACELVAVADRRVPPGALPPEHAAHRA